MASEQQQSPGAEKRIIKRYSNRKLYDTRDSRYVTLQQIGEMVRRGEDVQIIDNKSKEDKTEVTLALILSEDLKTKPRSVPLATLRTLIQERGERVLESLRESPLGRLIPGEKEGEEGEEGAEGEKAEGTEGAGAAEAATPAAPGDQAEAPKPSAGTDADESEAQADDDDGKKRGRLNELVESWQATLDERVAAIVPGVAAIRELRAEVRTLTQRVEELERQAGTTTEAEETKKSD